MHLIKNIIYIYFTFIEINLLMMRLFLDTRPNGSVLWISLYLLVGASVRPFATLDLRIGSSVFSDFLHGVTESTDLGGSGGSKKSKKMRFWEFQKNLIYSDVLFSLQYEGSNGLLTFWKIHIFEKNVVFESWSKNFFIYQDAGFFKLQYLTNELKCKAELLYVARHPLKWLV